MEAAGISPDETMTFAEDPYAGAADSWAAGQSTDSEPADDDAAARRLYDLALEFQERSQRAEARLLDDFETAAAPASERIGDLIIVDDDDERLVLAGTGAFRAEVIPEEADGAWRTLTGPEQLVEYYDPTDVFGDLADALAEAYPSVAPELAAEAQGSAEAEGTAAGTTDGDGDDDDDDDRDEDEDVGDGDEADGRGIDADAEDESDQGAEGRPTA